MTILLALPLVVGACGNEDGEPAAPGSDLPQGSEAVELDPADFTTEIDNPYWPMSVGSKWVYSETDSEGADQKVVVTVTPAERR